jgi:hypothetical protein
MDGGPQKAFTLAKTHSPLNFAVRRPMTGHYNDGYLPCVTTSRSLSVSALFLRNNA